VEEVVCHERLRWLGLVERKDLSDLRSDLQGITGGVNKGSGEK